MAQAYNNPTGGTPSSIGSQIRTDYYSKKALIEVVKEEYFMPLADVITMPKNMGKKIKQYHYLPLLDDRNINDQGIDANGVTLVVGQWSAWNAAGTLVGSAYASQALALTAAAAGGTVAANGGNLYGSSKDIGAITKKLPLLTENGGKVNRVGFKRVEIEGTITKFGFYDDYTEESVNFDTDEGKQEHIHREMLRGASQMTEAALQVDLLNAAGTVRFCGNATSTATMSGVAGSVCEVDYDDLMRFGIDLDNNRTPKHTKVITGSLMTDTKVINSARVLYVGSELTPTIRKMKDFFNNQAFIPVAHYAAAGTILTGEIGTIDQFRIVVVPEMLHWTGVGAAEGVNAGYRAENGKYNVYPMLCVGNESFTAIGFQTDGKSLKFKIKESAPGSPESYANDKFGETGFMSIKWYYGFMALRAERIGLIKTVAQV